MPKSLAAMGPPFTCAVALEPEIEPEPQWTLADCGGGNEDQREVSRPGVGAPAAVDDYAVTGQSRM
jgi:hypothetical protein